jgi:hypothetical protein
LITSANTPITYSISTNVTTADYTTLSIDASTGDPILVEMASSFIGTAEMTITATDSTGYIITVVFDVVVNACPQLNCDTCTGIGDGD